jgi:hypothetical protein
MTKCETANYISMMTYCNELHLRYLRPLPDTLISNNHSYTKDTERSLIRLHLHISFTLPPPAWHPSSDNHVITLTSDERFGLAGFGGRRGEGGGGRNQGQAIGLKCNICHKAERRSALLSPVLVSVASVYLHRSFNCYMMKAKTIHGSQVLLAVPLQREQRSDM